LRELFQQMVVQFLNLRRGGFACPLHTRSLDIPADHFAHFAGVKWLADVIVSSKAQSFFRRFQGAKSRQHDD
jgi:hypothetical protein